MSGMSLGGLTTKVRKGPARRNNGLKNRIKDGVDGEILYTSAGNLSFWRGIKNDDAYLATLHAYNTFLAEEYCAANRDRLIGVGRDADSFRRCCGKRIGVLRQGRTERHDAQHVSEWQFLSHRRRTIDSTRRRWI